MELDGSLPIGTVDRNWQDRPRQEDLACLQKFGQRQRAFVSVWDRPLMIRTLTPYLQRPSSASPWPAQVVPQAATEPIVPGPPSCWDHGKVFRVLLVYFDLSVHFIREQPS
jgi:hypothetical protein